MHPAARAGVNFRTVFAGRVRFGGVFRRSLRATTKKVVSFFGKKKCTPRQNLGYAYVRVGLGKEEKVRPVHSISTLNAYTTFHRHSF